MKLSTLLILSSLLLLSACRDLSIEVPVREVPGAKQAANAAAQPEVTSAVMDSVRAVDSMPPDAKAMIAEIGRQANH